MENIVSNVITFLGGGAVGSISSLVMLKPKKEAAVIENLKTVIDEVKDHYNDYKNDVEKRLSDLEKKYERLELKNTLLQQCVNTSYKCKFVPEGSTCPVVERSDNICAIIDQVGKDLKES